MLVLLVIPLKNTALRVGFSPNDIEEVLHRHEEVPIHGRLDPGRPQAGGCNDPAVSAPVWSAICAAAEGQFKWLLSNRDHGLG